MPIRSQTLSPFRFVCSLAFLNSACGEFTDEGSGSGTLRVSAEASYSVDTEETFISISISKPEQPLESTVITLHDNHSDRTRSLEFEGDGSTRTASLSTEFSGYTPQLELDIEGRTDRLEAKLEGPGRHLIASPLNGVTLQADDSFDVEWQTEDGLEADEVEVSLETSGFTRFLLDDEGRFEIDEGSAQIGEETIRVTRRNSIALAGGLPNSAFRLSFGVTADVLIVP